MRERPQLAGFLALLVAAAVPAAAAGAVQIAGAHDASPQLVYTPLAPCRVIDTRKTAAGKLAAGVPRSFAIAAAGYTGQGGEPAGCGLPLPTTSHVARAVALNVVVVDPDGRGHLVAWPANHPFPFASAVNYDRVGNLNLANMLVLQLCDEVSAAPCVGGDVTFLAAISGVHLVADVLGYFHESAGATGDVTAVFAGSGLVGGGTSGEVTLAHDPAGQHLPTCADGQVLMTREDPLPLPPPFGGPQWVCASWLRVEVDCLTPPMTPGLCVAECPSGRLLTGGGCDASGTLSSSQPDPLDERRWICRADDSLSKAYALCLGAP